jgi:hypothetical protein
MCHKFPFEYKPLGHPKFNYVYFFNFCLLNLFFVVKLRQQLDHHKIVYAFLCVLTSKSRGEIKQYFSGYFIITFISTTDAYV